MSSLFSRKKVLMDHLFSHIPATFEIIFLNAVLFIIFFIWLLISPDAIHFIALQPSAILSGNYLWTFVTSMFMHGGLFHLFANMFSLFFIGMLIERLIGKRRYITFYLISGLCASLLFILLSLIFRSDLNAYAVGASGALFGLIGFLMIITPNLPVYILFIPIPIKMKYAAPGMLVLLWLISLTPVAFGGEQIPIGNTAHLGGLLAGVVYGIYMRLKYKHKAALISRNFS